MSSVHLRRSLTTLVPPSLQQRKSDLPLVPLLTSNLRELEAPVDRAEEGKDDGSVSAETRLKAQVSTQLRSRGARERGFLTPTIHTRP